MPREDVEKLEILRDLYYGEPDNEKEVEEKWGLDPFAEPNDDVDKMSDFDDHDDDNDDDDDDGDDNDDDDDGDDNDDGDDIEWSPPKRRKTAPGRHRGAKRAQFNYSNWDWDFGPESSSEDKRRKIVPELIGPRGV